MYLIRVVPLARLPANAPAVLDYFWQTPLPQGSVVRATMHRRNIIAMVIESLDIRRAKLALKKSEFALKALDGVIHDTPQLSGHQMALARWISVQYACSLATCIKTVAPSFIGTRTAIDYGAPSVIHTDGPAVGDVILTQPDTAIARIQRVLRASVGQTLILVPERSLAESLAKTLPASVAIMHGGIKKPALRALYRGVVDGSVQHVIGTRAALFLPFTSLKEVIVEDPLNEMYKSDSSPRYNGPDVARKLAALHGARVTWLTPAISTVQYHLVSTGALKLIDEKPYWPHITVSPMDGERSRDNRSLFCETARDLMLDAFENKRSTLVLSSRRGYATVARCEACRASIGCKTCELPLRWNRHGEDMLVCYHCALSHALPNRCPACRRGTIRPSGIAGSQKLSEAIHTIRERFGLSKIDIPILDSDLVLTDADETRTLRALDAMPQPILVATSMVFGQRYTRTFDSIIVPNFDALSYSPDYRTTDRLIVQLEKLADFKPRTIIVQTRDDEPMHALMPHREWNRFFTEELAMRKSLLWPPYARLVKLTFTHRDQRVAAREATATSDRLLRAAAHLEIRGVRILGPERALVSRSNGRWTQQLILKHTKTAQQLAALLEYVPSGWVIDVDPRTIS